MPDYYTAPMRTFISLSSISHLALLTGTFGVALLCGNMRGAETANDFSKGVIDIGIVVQDANRTAEFLTNAIGFMEVKGFSASADLGRKIGLIDGYAVDVRVFALTGEPSTKIKVLSFPQANGKKADQKFIHSTMGYRYLTLYVKDMNKAVERLKAAKVKCEGETPLEMGGGTYIAVVKDPDGNFLELIGPKK
jgi:lactoylglutathione lyase